MYKINNIFSFRYEHVLNLKVYFTWKLRSIERKSFIFLNFYFQMKVEIYSSLHFFSVLSR